MNPNERTAQNQRSWDAVVPAHLSHHADLTGYLRNGGLTVFPEELGLLGALGGRTLLHLLCNTGQDTLSLAALGALATGVDLSPAAITAAQHLSASSGIAATFEQGEAYAWLSHAVAAGRRWERVLCSYGTVCWLHDLPAFAVLVAAVLAPGGRFALVEFHPFSNVFDAQWRPAHDYPAHGALLKLDGVGDYVAASNGALTPSGYAAGVQNFQNPEPCYLYRWGIGEVVTALAGAGLRIEQLREWPYTNAEQPFNRMRALGNRRFAPPANVPQIPLLYGVAALHGDTVTR